MSWSIDDFKATSLEVGQWCWGTLQGAFNEKQTISQVITDAAIGMIPLVGDATAVRDLLSVGIGMSSDPRKRQEVMQWVLFVVLIFALIPVVGGVIKGVGRLALRAAGDAAKDAELLQEVVQFLNRMGHGDAPQWLKALDVGKYQSQLLSKVKDFCATVRLAIERSLKARVGQLLPEVWRAQLARVGDGFRALQDLADQMVPQAVKELDAKLKTLQNMVYRGEIHEIATGGMPKVRREAEAYLEERKLARQIRKGKFPSAACAADGGEAEALIRAKYQPKIDEGWPNLFGKTGKMPVFGEETVFLDVASFHGEIKAVDAQQLAGKKLYRAFGRKSELATYKPGSSAGGRNPAYWGVGEAPKNAEEWRTRSAVLDTWNGNGYLVVLHLPEDFAERMPQAKAWQGKIAEQFGSSTPVQYLEGGGEQVVIALGTLADEITKVGEKIKAGERAANGPMIIDGIRVDFIETKWENVEKVYGYSRFEDDISYAAKTRRLSTDEVQSKVTQTNSVKTAAVRAGANHETQR
ncbi:hypothetical protein [Paraburkholderia caribensis]|uniref:hypothetical protein n=1 Tax=Paraburkholderia caribensis TaxID=75105 RepID=UPI00071FCD4E|nr:hypothetical protein [Paraburkholderia caribensis]ALP66186.1 hypothetical protein AN416_27340 [Paraburkholderia caribensis]AUT54882.1 hypothetical protein C2L66_24070 [Paraburkholderia caribensis]